LPISNALCYEGTLGMSKSKLSGIIKYIFWYHDKTDDSLKSHTVEVAVKLLFEAETLDWNNSNLLNNTDLLTSGDENISGLSWDLKITIIKLKIILIHIILL